MIKRFINVKMPDIEVSFIDDKYKKQAKILAKLIEYEVNKPEFKKKLDSMIKDLAKSTIENL